MGEDVAAVAEARGHSVIAEEHKGDLARAGELARIATGGAEAALARGVVALLAGEPAAAADALAGVVAGSDDPALRLRAASYHQLATYLRWNTFPGGGGAGATEITARWSGRKTAGASWSWDQLTEQVDDPGVHLEVHLVRGVLPGLRSVRVIVDHAAARLPDTEADSYLAEAMAVVDPLRGSEDAALRGYANLAAADLARRARRPLRAGELLGEAAAAYEAADDRAGVAACHLARGDWLAAPASTVEARNLFLVASAAESSTLDWALESKEATTAGRDIDAATTAYDAAEAGFEAAGAPRGLAAVTLRRAYLACLAGDHPGAVEQAARAGAAYDARGDRWGAMLAGVHETLAAVGAGRFTEGAATAAQVGRWGRTAGSFSYALGLGLLLSRSGVGWLRRRGDPERALACHRLARTLFASLGAVTDESQSLVDRGRVLQALGDHDGALAAYEEALGLLTDDLAARPAVAADNRLRAVTLAQTVYGLYLERRDHAGMARSVAHLQAQAACLPDGDGQSVEAALAAAARRTLAQAAVTVPLHRATHARATGDEPRAEADLAAALEAARAAPAGESALLEATVLAGWRRYADAAAAFRRYARSQATPTGLAARLLSRFVPGQAERELAHARLHEQAGSFFQRVRDYPEALGHFKALEEAGGDRWWRRLEQPWVTLSEYGAACEGAGELERALQLHEQAIAELETRRVVVRRDERGTALTRTAGAAPAYFAAARTALRLSQEAARSGERAQADALAAGAFRHAERGRARAMLDLLEGGAALANAPAGQSAAVRAWHRASARLSLRRGMVSMEAAAPDPDAARVAALRAEATTAEAEVLRHEAEMERADPVFAAAVGVTGEPPDLDEVRAALPAGAALLAYRHVDDDLLAWAITPEGLAASHRATADADELSAAIREFTSACVQGGDWETRGEELTPWLLEPFAELLERTDRLIVVPWGAAHRMPFHALPWRGGPLGATHAVSYLPSASALRQVRDGDARVPSRALVVGDPANSTAQPLPGQPAQPPARADAAAAEAGFVAALFAHARSLAGREATAAAVRAQIGQYPVVHVAAHGQLLEEVPLASCVLLADGDILSIYELMGIDLDAELVVLSACGSARGTVVPGGDVVGLARGLLGAGARSAVVSLWRADGQATCLVMAGFYRRLLGGAPAAVALQKAQAHVRRMDADAERAELTVVRAAADDPEGDHEVLRPIPYGQDPVDAEPGRSQSGRDPSRWAPFAYVGR